MGEKHGSSAGGDARSERSGDASPQRYVDSFERTVDEFERAPDLEDGFEDPQGWLGEHGDYWTDATAPRPSGECSTRLQRVLERLGGLWSAAGKGRGNSRLDGDGWPAARPTFGGVHPSTDSSPRRHATWRDAAWDLRLAQESRAERASRRFADLWDRLLGVDRGMSRLEEAGRKKHGPEEWISICREAGSSTTDEAELAQAVADVLDAPEQTERLPSRPFARRGLADRADGPIRSPLRNEFRLDGDGWERPLANDRAGQGGRDSLSKDELAAFFALTRVKAGQTAAGIGRRARPNSRP